ncbi:MAG: ECF transporter S component [Oscillospiraceae bacterium]|nr:ECF transporter S component [Oscillospiraceae bacterium]
MSKFAPSRQTTRLAVGGLLTAMVFLFTYFIKIPAPPSGYIHLGDGIIFLAGEIIGPFAAVCAGLGSALADVAGGYAVYAVPTLAIKAAMGAIAGLTLGGASDRGLTLRRAAALVLSEAMMVGGYALAESWMFGGASAAAAIPMNLIQGAAGIVIGIPLCALGERLKPRLMI